MAGPHDEAPALRFLTCGSVDDGKSTLIGRLLHDAGLIPEDQLAAIRRDSGGGEPDLSLVVDGLEAEREQGVTIDVAFRYFATPARNFIVADAPGHAQYLRNMAVAASVSDLAVLLVDARKGLLEQTRRHATICALFGVRQVLLAVNKIDLVDDPEAAVAAIDAAFRAYAAPLGFASITSIPVSARRGDNVVAPSAGMPWHRGPTLLAALEGALIGEPAGETLRMPVQLVLRVPEGGRAYAGRLTRGTLAAGDEVAIAPSGRLSRVEGLSVAGVERAQARAGESVAVRLAGESDVARGDMLCQPARPPCVGEQFRARLLWLDEAPLRPGRSYWLKIAGRSVAASVTAIGHRLDVADHGQVPVRSLDQGEIGDCDLATATPVAFDRYRDDRITGSFLLIDRFSGNSVAIGLIEAPLQRGMNVRAQALTVGREERAALKGHKPMAVWFTGLSGAGKSTIANLVEAQLNARGAHTILLDGDNLRRGLNRDLDFSAEDRVENIRRVAEVARLMTEAGLIVLCCFISPFRAERLLARETMAPGEFLEVYVHAPLDVAEQRDPKGLYARARAGEIANFTGIDQPYQVPQAPELRLDTTQLSAQALADRVIAALEERGIVAKKDRAAPD